MVAELLFKLAVHQYDGPMAVHHQHAAGGEFDGEAERLFWQAEVCHGCTDVSR